MRAHSRGFILKVIVGGGVIFASAIAGAFFITRSLGASDRYATGTIQLMRQGSTCQHLVIDNNTGAIKSAQQVPCGDTRADTPTAPPRSAESVPSRYSSGGRVDAVRDSFRSR